MLVDVAQAVLYAPFYPAAPEKHGAALSARDIRAVRLMAHLVAATIGGGREIAGGGRGLLIGVDRLWNFNHLPFT